MFSPNEKTVKNKMPNVMAYVSHIIPKTDRQSSTVRAKIPGTSMEFTKGIKPYLEMDP